MRRLLLAVGTIGLGVLAASGPAAAGLVGAAEVEHARMNALAGGPTNAYDADLLERYGCYSGTRSAFCQGLVLTRGATIVRVAAYIGISASPDCKLPVWATKPSARSPTTTSRGFYYGTFYETVPQEVRKQGPWQGMHRGEIEKLKPEYRLALAHDGYALAMCEHAVFKPEA